MPPKPARIALIHALSHAVEPINAALARDWPSATRMNLLDDSLSADLAASGRGQDAAMQARFARLAQYALDTGCQAILFTCSAFGTCIEAVAARHPHVPMLKPNEAMIDDAAALGLRLGLIASFAPTLASMPKEFPSHLQLDTAMAEGAMAALNAGDGARHDALVLEAAQALAAKGCQVIALAQFSMARAAPLVQRRTGLRVLTPVDSAVAKLKRVLQA
jgi:aspartate/glutamate racemase